ncbi:MAG: hypothetical protein ACKVVT_18935 [Dehalococcoidia bacterium]
MPDRVQSGHGTWKRDDCRCAGPFWRRRWCGHPRSAVLHDAEPIPDQPDGFNEAGSYFYVIDSQPELARDLATVSGLVRFTVSAPDLGRLGLHPAVVGTLPPDPDAPFWKNSSRAFIDYAATDRIGGKGSDDPPKLRVVFYVRDLAPRPGSTELASPVNRFRLTKSPVSGAAVGTTSYLLSGDTKSVEVIVYANAGGALLTDEQILEVLGQLPA